MDYEFLADLKRAEDSADAIDASHANTTFFENREDKRIRRVKLYSVLSSYLRNRPLKVLRVEGMNGFEVWRKLTAELEPPSRSSPSLSWVPSYEQGSIVDGVGVNE